MRYTRAVDPANLHVLKGLRLPDRFETLSALVGPRVAELLVAPALDTIATFRTLGLAVKARGQGMIAPVYAPTGAGKTTLAHALSTFLPDVFASSAVHNGAISADMLSATLVGALKPGDDRVIPLLVDHREGAPPTEIELAEIKRFLRTADAGARTVVLWPETDSNKAKQIAQDYEALAGAPPVPMPLLPAGPERSTWRDVALHTLKVCNDVDNLEDLGVNPISYDPERSGTLGEFLRKISNDFVKTINSIITSSARLIHVVIMFACETPDHGILSNLTSNAKFGLLSANALLDATRDSAVGRWWATRRGVLTQTILKLDAHAFCLPPHMSVAIISNYGPSEAVKSLEGSEYKRPSKARVREYLSRTDLGKFLQAKAVSGYETRGRPSENASKHFQVLHKLGFTYGRDKRLNKAVLEALIDFYNEESLPFESSLCEQGLDFANLIPDNAILTKGNEVLCFEYTWRGGDFLSSTSRATVAGYALEKLKTYALALGWATD